MARPRLPRPVVQIWSFLSHVSLAIWLWSTFGGAAASGLSFLGGLPLGWVVFIGLLATLLMAAVLTTRRERQRRRNQGASVAVPAAARAPVGGMALAIRGPTPLRKFQPRTQTSLGQEYLRTEVNFRLINNQTPRDWSLLVNLDGWVGDRHITIDNEDWMAVYHQFPPAREGYLANPREVLAGKQVLRPMPFLVPFEPQLEGTRLERPRLVLRDLKSPNPNQRVVMLPASETQETELRWAEGGQEVTVPNESAAVKARLPRPRSPDGGLQAMARLAIAQQATELKDWLIEQMKVGEEFLDVAHGLIDIAGGTGGPTVGRWYRTVYYRLLQERPHLAMQFGSPTSPRNLTDIKNRLNALEQIVLALSREGDVPIL